MDFNFLNKSPIKPLEIGTSIREYEVIKHLGRNNFETTYLCNDSNLERQCVLKEYTPINLACRLKDNEIKSLFSTDYNMGLHEFMKTAKWMASVKHPNIIKINHLFRANKTAYIVMDFEPGENLRQIMSKRETGFEEIEVESILFSICEGLEQLHKKYVIHRNIRPESIIIRPDGSTVLTELSFIGYLNTLNEETNIKFERNSYNPPELFEPDIFNHGPWIDIYSLGALLYELIALAPSTPFPLRINGENSKSITDIGRGKFGSKLLALIDKCLSVDYLERPLSIEELFEFFETDKFKILRSIYKSISWKAVQHFLNWAKPNPGLYIDEFVTFIVAFGVIDMTWRQSLSKLWSPILFERLIDQELINFYMKLMMEAGFTEQRRIINPETIKSRIDEYSATCLLDRQEEKWKYTLTRKACSRYCIKEANSGSRENFMGLMENVMDSYRGRVKKELDKLNT